MFCNISLNAQAVFLFRCDVFFSHRHELYFSVATARPCARVKSTFAVLRSVVFTLLITGKWRLFTAYSLNVHFQPNKSAKARSRQMPPLGRSVALTS